MGLFFDSGPEGSQQQDDPIEPLWLIDPDDEEEVLKWGKRMYDLLDEYYQPRDQMIFESVSRYLGKYFRGEPRTSDRRMLYGDIRKRKNDFPRVITNHYKSLVDQKVSMQIKYKPDTDIIPDSWGQYQDKTDADAAKKFLKGVKDFNRADLLWPRFVRRSILTGQAFIVPEWNSRAGKRKGKETRSVTVKNSKDVSMSFDVPEYRGEICFRFPLSQHVRLFPSDSSANCTGMLIISYPDVHELKLHYPDKADKIKPGKNLDYFDYNYCEYKALENKCIQLEYYIRSNDAAPNGLYIKMTPDCLLEEVQDNPIPVNDESRESMEFGDLPCVRLTDTELDGDVNGYPSTLDIHHQQHIFDKLTTHFVMNVAYFCHPKWVAQKNTIKFKQLEDIPGLVVEHTGTTDPKLQVFSAITQDQFALRAAILEGMEKVFGVYSTSRGSPPPGTRAAAQLYYYDEQEAQLNAPFKRKFDHATEVLDILCLSLMSKHYDGDSQRLVYLLGEDKKWLAESIDVSSLKRRFVVRSKAGSNLPDSKYARLNALFELYGMNPNETTWAQLMDMVDNGQQEKLIDNGKQAIIAAEKENEALQAGRDVASPSDFEPHIDHLKVHYKLLWSPEFKNQDKKIQTAVEDHVGAQEALLIAKSEMNQALKPMIQALLPMFPVLAPLPPVNPMAMMQQPPPGAPGGQGPQRSKGVGPAEALGLQDDEQLKLQG